MPKLWMAIVPGPEITRVLVQNGPEETLLKARLPRSPRHPRAIETLCEALALWSGQRVCAALVADGSETSCGTKPWLDTFDAIARTPLFEIQFVSSVRPTRERDRLEGLGSFRDLRRLILTEVAR